METSHPKFKQMMALFTQTGQIGYKHTYAYEVSFGRTESTKELNLQETETIIAKLLELDPSLKNFEPKPGDQYRKNIIAIARDMRWDIKSKNDMMKRIDDFMLNRTKYKKRFNDLTEDELIKVQYIFVTEVKPSYFKGLNK